MRPEQKKYQKERADLESRNKALAKFMGWWLESIRDYTHTWYYKGESAIYVAISQDTSYPYRDLPFSTDMNLLFKVIDRLRETIKPANDRHTQDAEEGDFFMDRFEINYNSFFGTLIQWKGDRWKMLSSGHKDMCSYYIVGENCDSYQQGLFYFISDLVSTIVKDLPEPQNPNNALHRKMG